MIPTQDYQHTKTWFFSMESCLPTIAVWIYMIESISFLIQLQPVSLTKLLDCSLILSIWLASSIPTILLNLLLSLWMKVSLISVIFKAIWWRLLFFPCRNKNVLGSGRKEKMVDKFVLWISILNYFWIWREKILRRMINLLQRKKMSQNNKLKRLFHLRK